MGLRDALLECPANYLLFQWLVGGTEARRALIERFVLPRPGMRILDVGCGPGHVLEWLVDVEYTGTDMDAAAIAHAKRRYGHRARFVVTDPAQPVPADVGRMDVILMCGVMHHLDDRTLGETIARLADCLAPGGRLFTLDGCYYPDTRGLRGWLLASDRGRHVRTESQYRDLLSKYFPCVEMHRERRLFRVPYDALVTVCGLG